jgi:hypothetical protein
VNDNNGSDSILVNSWQIQQFWQSVRDVYIPHSHRSDVSVHKHGQGNDEACCCLRLLARGRLKILVIANVSGAAKVMCQTVCIIIQSGYPYAV